MKIGHHFQAKKTSATPKFCKRNFSRMYHVVDMNLLSLIAPIFEVQKTWIWNFESKNFYQGGIISVYNTIKDPGGIIFLVDFFRQNEQ